MKKASWGLGLPASVLGALLAAGCGENRTNEEVVVKSGSPTAAPTGAPTGPSYSNYSDYAKAQSKATAKAKEAPKGKGAEKTKL